MHAYANTPEPQPEPAHRWVHAAHGALRKLTADDVERMLIAGILTEDDPVELLDGALIAMSPQGNPHYVRIVHLTRLFSQAWPHHFVAVQGPLNCGPHNRPEPDLVVLPEPAVTLADGGRADQATLVVEVAVTSQARDRAKGELYARSGVSEYWVLDLANAVLEIYRQPLPSGRWAQTALLKPSATVQPPGLGVTWAVADLLGVPSE